MKSVIAHCPVCKGPQTHHITPKGPKCARCLAKGRDYAEARKDAGLFREYMALHFGSAFTFGAASDTYWRGYRLAGELARLTGMSRIQIINDIRADYETQG
jgi:hypothetical protein